MPKRKYVITLTDKERKELIKFVKSGTSSARLILRANILLSSDSSATRNLTVAETSELYHTTPTTVQTVRTAYAESGLEGAL